MFGTNYQTSIIQYSSQWPLTHTVTPTWLCMYSTVQSTRVSVHTLGTSMTGAELQSRGLGFRTRRAPVWIAGYRYRAALNRPCPAAAHHQPMEPFDPFTVWPQTAALVHATESNLPSLLRNSSRTAMIIHSTAYVVLALARQWRSKPAAITNNCLMCLGQSNEWSTLTIWFS